MRYLVTGTQMKEIDRYTIEEVGIPSLVLMERAAMAVAEEVERSAGKTDSIWIVCGDGNNGADGIGAARMLYGKGYLVSVILAANDSQGTEEYALQLSIAQKLGVSVIEFSDFIPGRCDVIVDAVFGVGLNRTIGGLYRDVMELMAGQTPRILIAVDIPSGIHGDTGSVMGMALKADVTVTFGWEKLGTVLFPGRAYSGRVVIADIGFPEMSFNRLQCHAFTYGRQDKSLVPERTAYSNKGSFGKILIVAGSKNMSGAAYLSALSAYRMGAGLVKILTVEENRIILQEQLPEAIIETYQPSWIESDYEKFAIAMEKQCRWASVIVLGPGLGRGSYVARLVEAVLTNAYVPIILDADGLNAVADHPHLAGYYTENIIITPHLGEMSRLAGLEIQEIQADIAGAARSYASRYGLTCVLKDAATVVARKDGLDYINTTGCSAMAKAGSGDVLTGIIAGLLALGLEESEAASLGVCIHGLAGEKAAESKGSHGVLARDLADALTD